MSSSSRAETLTARQGTVERSHGTGVAFVLILEPGAHDGAEDHRQPWARTSPFGPDEPISAAASIHCCDRTERPFSAKARPGLRVAERASETGSRALYGASASNRCISTSNSRSRRASSLNSSSR